MTVQATHSPPRPSADLEFDCKSAERAQGVRDALAPELRGGPEGATVVAEVNGGRLAVAIVADDLSTLRAAVTSVARLVDAALGVWPADDKPMAHGKRPR